MTKGFVSEIFYAYTGLKRSYNTQLSNYEITEVFANLNIVHNIKNNIGSLTIGFVKIN